jgi:hypothetical protein
MQRASEALFSEVPVSERAPKQQTIYILSFLWRNQRPPNTVSKKRARSRLSRLTPWLAISAACPAPKTVNQIGLNQSTAETIGTNKQYQHALPAIIRILFITIKLSHPSVHNILSDSNFENSWMFPGQTLHNPFTMVQKARSCHLFLLQSSNLISER